MAPASPAGLMATAQSPEAVRLEWVDTADDETGVEVERGTAMTSFTQVAALPADSVAYIDTGLTDQTSYRYRVRFVRPGGPSDYSAPVEVTTPIDAPIGPVTFNVTPTGRTTADLIWVNTATREDAVLVERRVVGGLFATVATLPADSTAFADTGLQADTEYEYRIYFSGPGGDSPRTSILAIRTDRYHFYVNPDKGNDMGSGSRLDPLRTLTVALAMAVDFETIQALPGTYDGAHGEMLPLFVPENVTLKGDEATQGIGGPVATEVVGSGSVPGESSLLAAVILDSGATLAGFRINTTRTVPTANEVGVLIGSGGAGVAVTAVRNCTMVQCDTGLRIADGSKTNTIRDCRMLGNEVGIVLESTSGVGNLVETTSSFGNDIGIVIRANGADLGGGTENGAGGNTFSCNTLADLSSNLGPGEIVFARDCFWDRTPPSISTAPGTSDIVLGQGGIDVTGAMLAPGACP